MKTRALTVALLAGALTGCMKWEYGEPDDSLRAHGDGLYIVNEGNFQYGNATLSYYNPETKEVENEVFFRANGMRLGDVAQSMTTYDDKGWIIVNNSHVIFTIDLDTFRETGRIENLTSPRYIYFVNSEKAYVSQLWDNRIFIVNPRSHEITGYIYVPGMTMETGSTEQMVGCGGYVYCNCWSYQNRIIRIDPAIDEVTAELTVGIQPVSLVVDCNDKLWTLTDGGYDGSPYGYEPPALYRIDPDSFTVEREYRLKQGTSVRDIVLNGTGDTIYWINDDVWRMDVKSDVLPDAPFIPSTGTKYYSLTVDPHRGDVYLGDAIDYQQQGIVYHYSSSGTLLDRFYVGVTPGAFCWKYPK